MNKSIKLLSPFVIILSLFLIICFKSIPNSKLWKEYSVLYTNVECNEQIVINELKAAGIGDYVALSEQYLPLNLSANSIEISMLKLNKNNEDFNYYIKRNNFFFDKSNKYKLYYIPVSEKSKLNDCLGKLNAQKITCGVDSASSYPWLLPVICLLLIIMLSLFSKNKYVFICSAIPCFVYVYSNPFYPIAVSTCLVLLCLFFISNLWRRKDAFIFLLTNYAVPAMLAISLICSFSSTVKSGFIFFIELISIASILFTYFFVEEFIRSRRSFIPVYIKPAKMISIFANKTKSILLLIIASVFIVIAIFILSNATSVNSHFSKLLLPSDSSISSDNLPQLNDYYKWNWNVKTYPYRSLNKDSEENTIQFPRYVENDEGLLTEEISTLEYNQDFKDSVYNEIDNLQFNSIEKVIKSEGKSFNAGYSSTSNYHTNLFGIIMMFICLFILLFIYISIIIKKENKK